ncbi:MAG: four helix bundle protein [Vicinamibacteria bacterium]
MSIALNLSEGAGCRSPRLKARYYQIARGSASECGAVIANRGGSGVGRGRSVRPGTGAGREARADADEAGAAFSVSGRETTSHDERPGVSGRPAGARSRTFTWTSHVNVNVARPGARSRARPRGTAARAAGPSAGGS